jgi:hypothetical protein
MAQYMTYDTTVDSDIWYFEGVFKKSLMALSEAGKIFESLSNAPKAVIRGVVQTEKATFAQTAIFWGCAA